MKFIKKLRAYFLFRRKIFSSRQQIFQKHGLYIDQLARMYKVITLSKEELMYGAETKFLEKKIRDEVQQFNSTFEELGIIDLVELDVFPMSNYTESEMRASSLFDLSTNFANAVYPNSFAIVLKFRLFNSERVAKNFLVFLAIIFTFLIIASIITII